MKFHYPLLVLALLGAIAAQAQSLSDSPMGSYYTYIFAMPAEEVRERVKKPYALPDTALFRTAIDSFPRAEGLKRKLSPGDYFFVWADAENWICEWRNYPALTLHLPDNERDLSFWLSDSLGKPVTDAQVKLGRRSIRFDPLTQSYRLPDTRKEGLLAITYQGHTDYVDLADDKDEPYYLRGPSGLRRIVYSKPLRYVWRPPVLFVKGIVQSLWTLRPRGWIGSMVRLFSTYPYNPSGYIVTDQPIYRAGDTVRAKAIVLNAKGRPVNAKLTASISGRQLSGYKTIYTDTLRPYRKGAYSWEFVLHDSMNFVLNQGLDLTLIGRGRRYMSHSIELRDYELTRSELSFRSARKVYYPGEEITFFVQGKDENGLNLAEVRAEITILPRSQVLWQKEGFMPDTLWKKTLTLDPVGETRVVLTDSLLPPATFDFFVEVALLTTDNERQTDRTEVKYINQPERFEIAWENDSLAGYLIRMGKRVTGRALLTAKDIKGRQLFADSVDLPMKRRLLPSVATYSLSKGETKAQTEKASSLLSASATRNADSLWISVSNPRKLSFSWQLFYRNRELRRGSGDSLVLAVPTVGPANYFLAIQCLWQGAPENQNYTMAYADKAMQVKLEQPLKVYPGQTDTISLEVLDAKGRPVKDADVLAYANTSKFKGDAPSLPDFSRSYPGRTQLHIYATEAIERPTRTQALDMERWEKRWGLDSLLWYDFLYPAGGMDTFHLPASAPDHTEYAPFVLDSAGNFQDIQLIWLDEEPVYYSGVENQPYVYTASPGYHEIRIRTRFYYLVLDSVFLAAGKKNVIAVNVHKPAAHVKVQSMKPTFSVAETQMLRQRIMPVQKGVHDNYGYIHQGDRIWTLGGSFPANIGPMKAGYIHMVQPEGFKIQTQYEPGFSYEFSSQLVKMRSLDPNRSFAMRWNAPSSPEAQRLLLQKPFSEAFMNARYEAYMFNAVYRDYIYENPDKTEPGMGRLRIQLPPDTTLTHMLLFDEGNPDFIRIYPANGQMIHQLMPGSYEVVVFRRDSSVYQRQGLLVKANGSAFYDLSTWPISPVEARWKALYRLNLLRLKTRSGVREAKQWAKEAYYQANTTPSLFNHWISGYIYDESGEPLEGVPVVIKGTNRGALTNTDGYFSLMAPAEGVLVISYVGYETQEVLIAGRTSFVQSLSPAFASLDEVIVVAYGSQRKQSVTGAVSSISAYNRAEVQGKVAGLEIRGSRDNNTVYLIDDARVRGSNSIRKNELLQWVNPLTAIYGTALIDTLLYPGAASAIRHDFSDHAFWQPRLRTDANGKASFPVTYPDDITRWNTYALAVASHKRTGLAAASTQSYLPLSGRLFLPRFAIAGDSIRAIGSTQNLSGDSVSVSRTLRMGEKALFSASGGLLYVQTDTLTFSVPAGADSTTLVWRVETSGGYFDGEQRSLPVYPVGAPAFSGGFYPLPGADTLHLAFDPAHGPVQLRLEADLIGVYRSELQRLHSYKHYCNEQAASKLKALLLDKRLTEKSGKAFHGESDIRSMIRRLEKSQSEKGYWGWWDNGLPEIWITRHAASALIEAEKAGYTVKFRRAELTEYLLFRLPVMGVDDRLRSLYILRDLGAKADFAAVLDSVSRIKKLSFPLYVESQRLRQLCGLSYDSDSLLRAAQHTLSGNLYWTGTGVFPDAADMDVTLTVYALMRDGGADARTQELIRRYLLEQRRYQGCWRNTYEAARALDALLPEVLAEAKSLKEKKVYLSGALLDSVSTFPYTRMFAAGDSLHLRAKGGGMLYASLSQTWFDPAPEPISGELSVHTWLGDKNSPQTILSAGKPVTLTAEVEVRGDAEYVLVEIPIPAGCSYESEVPALYVNGESGREYSREALSIYCQRLAPGTHRFEVRLVPRFAGRYTLNPAHVEPMYVPFMGGREAVKKVEVR